jgi:CRISP-associated protein Cas1
MRFFNERRSRNLPERSSYQESSKPKEILHSQRGNLEYLEHCRVMVKDGRVLYLHAKEEKKVECFWNIPIANTTVVLLGTGTSITQAAVRMMSEAGVLVGFCGTGGTPLIAGTDVEWITPQSEYRPTEYVQGWLKFWFDDQKRLTIAKHFQQSRIDFLKHVWSKETAFVDYGIEIEDRAVQKSLQSFLATSESSKAVTDLLAAEGRLTKDFYKYVANNVGIDDFTRDPASGDKANGFLNHGNYLAYGLAATCLWCLGIPHGFAVMHGKTRRGALVFDVADLIKDAVVLPQAFISASSDVTEREFRESLLERFTKHRVLDRMFEVMKQAVAVGANLS